MVIFGLILLLLSLAVIAYMWFATEGMPAVDIDYGVLNVSLEPFWLFVAGGIALATATSGLWIMAMGTRSTARKSREMRELRRNAKESERRAERAQDSAALDQRPGAGRTTPTTGDSRPRGTTPASPSRDEGPILPRRSGADGSRTPGASGGRSNLDLDPPRG